MGKVAVPLRVDVLALFLSRCGSGHCTFSYWLRRLCRPQGGGGAGVQREPQSQATTASLPGKTPLVGRYTVNVFISLGICGRSRGGGKCCFALQKEENFATQLETCATRVTSRETRTGTACGSDLASDEPVGGRGNEPGAHADRHPSLPRGGRRPEVPAPPSLPAQVPTRCLQGKDSGGELATPGGRRTGARLGRRTAFQERATRN